METFGNKNSDVAIHKPVERGEGWVAGKALAVKFSPWDPRGVRRKMTPVGCPLTSTWALWQAGVHTCNTHTPIKKFIFIRGFDTTYSFLQKNKVVFSF